ncbi:MAG: DUF5709 domain-containing protein [Candidatus Nanopelagicales bacterium]
MTEYDRTVSGRRGWREDPARDVMDELYRELSEDLGTDGPEETFGHPDDSRVGRLIEDDEGWRPDETSDTIAHDSHDVDGLSAEEAAMHYMDEEALDADDASLRADVELADVELAIDRLEQP